MNNVYYFYAFTICIQMLKLLYVEHKRTLASMYVD